MPAQMKINRSATTKTLDYLKPPMYETKPTEKCDKSAVKFSRHRHVLY